MRRRNFSIAALVSGAASGWMPALAQGASPAWPARPVRLLHGFATGGPVDNLARQLAILLAQELKQPVIVEGKPGAGATIAAQQVAKSVPDGYTLFFMASGHSAAPGLYPSLPFDPVEDFTMVSMVARSPFVILAGPSAPQGGIRELVAAARTRPGAIDYGSGGVGSGMHLAAVLFERRAELQLTHVAYKGGSAPSVAVMSGEVPIIFTSLAGVAQTLKGGKVRALAVTSKERVPEFPAVPTLAESVLPGFEVNAWYALAGPAQLPPAIVSRLNGVMQRLLRRPDVVHTMRLQSAEPWPGDAREARDFLVSDVAHWTRILRDERIRPGQ